MQSTSHQTTGTERRPAHQLSGEGLRFRLHQEIDLLRQDLKSSSGQRSAKTLTKAGSLRVTLVVMDANASMTHNHGGATLQVLEGRLQVQNQGQPEEVGAGELMILDDSLREPIRAMDQSAFLITVAWREGAGAWSQEAAQGRL
jgi:mannose-6-phosphate isomerase-like protein (cupin superfamily)